MIYTIPEINELISSIHKANVEAGWWDHEDVDPLEKLGLAISELSEATEGVRKNLMDDKLPHRKMEEVEMADAFIRLCDFAGRYGFKYDEATAESQAYILRCYTPRKNPVAQLAVLKALTAAIALTILENSSGEDVVWCGVIYAIMHHCNVRGLDLRGAVEEKLAFNKVRPDHTREARAEADGKKY